MSLLSLGVEAIERGWVADSLVRTAVRRLCVQRLQSLKTPDEAAREDRERAFVESTRAAPIALVPDAANAQHYEVPAAFFGAVLGSRRKYSCCYFADDSYTLDEAEEAALEITAERAELRDGQRVLELGCGWGSFSLWLAERHPRSRVTAVSNSRSQQRYIETRASERGLKNLRVVVADMNEFQPPAEEMQDGYDRVVSVEMFEHMRNHAELLRRIASWMKDDAKLFVHIFTHRDSSYLFEDRGAADWMSRHFFSGGMMPAADLLPRYERDLRTTRRWTWNGKHYERTANAWLERLDAQQEAVDAVLESVYGRREAARQRRRWRIFFMAVAELFAWRGGDEWFVSHYLLEPVR